MSTTAKSGWEPAPATPRPLPVAPGLATTYMKLFVNRLPESRLSRLAEAASKDQLAAGSCRRAEPA